MNLEVTSKFPDVAAKKLAALQQAASDAHALAQAAKRQVNDAGDRVQKLVNAHASEADIDRALTGHERAQDLMMSRGRTYEANEQLAARCRSWLNELPAGTRLEAAPTPLIAVNGSPSVVVGTLRSEISRLSAEYHQIVAAQPTRDDAKAQIKAMVSRLALSGRPRIDVQRGEVRVSGWMGDGSGVPTPHSVTLAFMAWMDPERMVGALERELAAVPVDEGALPLDQRKNRLAEIESEILLLEDREEAVIQRAARDGNVIPRRDTASPQAILGVRVATARARAA